MFAALFVACTSPQTTKKHSSTIAADVEPIYGEAAYFASGCFWCVEAIYESVNGVREAISGYAGGSTAHPTYRQISSGLSDHAEVVKVVYDPKVVDFKTLLMVFFESHDPTTLNQQGPDRGAQYRSIAFYKTKEEKELIESFIDSLNKNQVYAKEVVTEVQKLTQFWRAEEEHQDFEANYPNHPYIKNVSVPRLQRFQEKYPGLLK